MDSVNSKNQTFSEVNSTKQPSERDVLNYVKQIFEQLDTMSLKRLGGIINGKYKYDDSAGMRDSLKCPFNCEHELISTAHLKITNLNNTKFVKFQKMDKHIITKHDMFPKNSTLYLDFLNMLDPDDIESFKPSEMITELMWKETVYESGINMSNPLVEKLFQKFLKAISVKRIFFDTGHIGFIFPKNIDYDLFQLRNIFDTICVKLDFHYNMIENEDIAKTYYLRKSKIDEYFNKLNFTSILDLIEIEKKLTLKNYIERIANGITLYDDYMEGIKYYEKIIEEINELKKNSFIQHISEKLKIYFGCYEGMSMFVIHNTSNVTHEPCITLSCHSPESINILKTTALFSWYNNKKVTYAKTQDNTITFNRYNGV